MENSAALENSEELTPDVPEEENGVDIFGGSLEGPTNYDKRYISSIPPLEKGPIIAKLMPVIVDGKRKQYISVVEFPHCTGEGEKDKGRHACQQTFDRTLSSPEMDHYKKLKINMEALKKEKYAAKNAKNTAEEGKIENKIKKLDFEMKKFKPRFSGWFNFVEPGSDTIKSIKFPPSMINILNGAKETHFRAAIPSLQEKLVKRGYSAFLTAKANDNSLYWLKIYKTGEGIATKYFIDIDQNEVANDDGSTTTKPVKHPLGQGIEKLLMGKSKMNPSDLPDPISEVEERFNKFSHEEAERFVELGGGLNATPANFLKQENRSDSGNVSSDPESGEAATAPVQETAEVDDMF